MVKPNDEGIRKIYEQVGERVRTIVNNTAQETADQDPDTAIDTLHQRLTEAGIQQPRTWSQNAIETLRRGDDLKIVLE